MRTTRKATARNRGDERLIIWLFILCEKKQFLLLLNRKLFSWCKWRDLRGVQHRQKETWRRFLRDTFSIKCRFCRPYVFQMRRNELKCSFYRQTSKYFPRRGCLLNGQQKSACCLALLCCKMSWNVKLSVKWHNCSTALFTASSRTEGWRSAWTPEDLNWTSCRSHSRRDSTKSDGC